jgi:CBS domain-containing protein
VYLTVEDVMVEKVVTVDISDSVKYAAKLMSSIGIGCVVVLEERGVVGIVTERDLIQRVIVDSVDPGVTRIKEIMSTPPIVVDRNFALEKAVELMFEHGIKKLPVVERVNDKMKLVGLVTLTDIARIQPKIIETLKDLFVMRGEAPPRSMEKVMKYYIV